MRNMSRKPTKTFKSSLSYAVSVSVWENDGKLSLTIQKRVKDKETNEYKEYKSFFASDAAALRECLTRAIQFIDEYRNEVKGTDSNGVSTSPHFDDDDTPAFLATDNSEGTQGTLGANF